MKSRSVTIEERVKDYYRRMEVIAIAEAELVPVRKAIGYFEGLLAEGAQYPTTTVARYGAGGHGSGTVGDPTAVAVIVSQQDAAELRRRLAAEREAEAYYLQRIAEARAGQAALGRALDRLKPEYRAAMEAIYLHGGHFTEVAAAQCLEESSARARVAAALEDIGRYLRWVDAACGVRSAERSVLV